MSKVIYAIKIRELATSELKIVNVKIGQTSDIKSTLRQYKRSNPDIELLDLWEPDLSMNNIRNSEKGIHKLAGRYAYRQKGETFIFLQESYRDFAENVNLLLKNVTNTYRMSKRKHNIRRRQDIKGVDYTNKEPRLMIFRGKSFEVNTWREVLCKIAEEIYKDKKDFSPALEIRGRKKVYFSENDENLVVPLKIEGTSYFCEGNNSANGIVKIVKKLLHIFGYNEEDLKIDCS